MTDVEESLRNAALWKQRIQLDKDQVAEVVGLIDEARDSRAEKIVAAMDTECEELNSERQELFAVMDYHEEVISSGNGAVINFYEKSKARDRIMKINDELRHIHYWMKKGE